MEDGVNQAVRSRRKFAHKQEEYHEIIPVLDHPDGGCFARAIGPADYNGIPWEQIDAGGGQGLEAAVGVA